MRFSDRREAGQLLAKELEIYKDSKDAIVLGLARGGVVVAAEIAKTLHLPLNVVVPRKIGAPYNPELAIGAIMEDGEGVFNTSILRMLDVPESFIQNEIEKEKAVAKKRLALFRKNVPLPKLKDKNVILVDDGIATGATMQAAIKSIRKAGAERIIVAVPVAASQSLTPIETEVDQIICLFAPDDLGAIGFYYNSFDQTDDIEVIQLLEEAKK